MSYICCVHAASAEPLLFKRKEAKQLMDKLTDDLDPTLSPGPNLRSDQVVNGNIPRRFIWPPPAGGNPDCRSALRHRAVFSGVPAELAVFAVNAGKMADHFGQAHHGQAGRINDRLIPRRPEFGPAHP
jgi:hypothetical protein